VQIDPLLVDIITIAVTLTGAFLIIKIINHFIRKAIEQFNFEITLLQVLQEIVKYTVIAFALVIILNELGINVSSLVLSLGIVGIAVGFAARDTLSNFISGLFILGDKSFKVGDIIEISQVKGKVIRVGFRITTIVTPDKKTITVPNSSFSKNPYTNYTAVEKRRLDLELTIPYELKLEDTIKSVENAASKLSWVLNKPEPHVLITELSDTGIKATLNVWVDDPWEIAEYKSSLARKVKDLLVSENA
jgi:small conductance mechanosensitive channel